MNIIREMAAAGCFIGLALYAADILKPDDRFAVQVRFIFSLIFITVIITPFMKGDIREITESVSEKVCTSDVYSISSSVEKDMTENIEKNTERSLSLALSERGISHSDLRVTALINESYSVSITSISLHTENESAASEILRELTGDETCIEFT